MSVGVWEREHIKRHVLHRETPYNWAVHHCGGIRRRSNMCRMVGRPWGQFHGWLMVDIWSMMPRIRAVFKAVPIITEVRQARDANMARTRDGRHILCGSSVSMKMSSSTSEAPNVVPLL
eukprot:m.1424376 g.1424376  ORF g.1424376 m.1424376 type:complete len:119 (-) comp25061_c0_seq19:2605-2961(-)